MYLPDLHSYLIDNLPGYISERRDTQQLICKIIFLPNRDYNHSDAISLSTAYIKALGHNPTTFHRVNSKYGFYTFSKSYHTGQAKLAYPSAFLTELLTGFIHNVDIVDCLHMDNTTGKCRVKKAIPSDKPLSVGGLSIAPTVKVDIKALLDLMQQEEDNLTLDIATKFFRLAHTKQFPKGHIPQSFRQIPNGRVVGMGLTFQNIPKSLRTALLNGYYDYDFQCCHYAILSQQGLYTPSIEMYIRDTSQIREGLAIELDVEVKDIKRCLLSLIYGATDNPSPFCAIAGYIGKEKVKTFFHHVFIQRLVGEIQEVSNMLGIECKKDLANFMMGEEHKILRELTSALSIGAPLPPLLVPFYDGFISTEDYNLKELESIIKVTTGYNITMTKEEIKYEFS